MPVDVLTEIVIQRPRLEVAAYACDPDHATARYRNLTSVEWATELPVGTQLAFIARFLGRRIAYTYQVQTLIPGWEVRDEHRREPIPDGDDLHVARHRLRRDSPRSGHR